jgi:hypothetical protein
MRASAASFRSSTWSFEPTLLSHAPSTAERTRVLIRVIHSLPLVFQSREALKQYSVRSPCVTGINEDELLGPELSCRNAPFSDGPKPSHLHQIATLPLRHGGKPTRAPSPRYDFPGAFRHLQARWSRRSVRSQTKKSQTRVCACTADCADARLAVQTIAATHASITHARARKRSRVATTVARAVTIFRV